MKPKPTTKNVLIVTLRQVVDAKPALDDLVRMHFPAAVAFKIGRLVSLVQGELVLFGQKRDELARRCGAPSADDPNVLSILPERREEWDREMNELLEVKIELSSGGLLEADLERAAEGLTVVDCLLLRPFVT